MDIKYFITDLDGVIFNRMPVYLSAITEVLRPFGIPEDLLRSYYYGTLGTPVELQTVGVLSKFGIKVEEEELKKLVKDFWTICARHQTELFPGVKETLDKIKSRGIFLMASSGSNTDDIGRIFKKYDLPYDFFLGSDRVLKGDEHIKIFADHFSIEKVDFCRQAVFIGDGTTDMQIASRNGIFGIGITNTIPAEDLLNAGAKAIVSNMAESLDYI